MFGFRPDGRRIDQDDAILAFGPYLMPQRVDAQVYSVQHVDCDILTRYIRDQRAKGHVLTYMDLVVAAYVRVVSQMPEINRFIMNKQLYARNDITISMVVLKQFDREKDKIQESTIKLHFSPHQTVYEIHDILQKAIEDNRRPEQKNGTDKVARLLLALPGVPSGIVMAARLLDRYGIMPRYVVEVSPFHTGLFLVNMASLGMPYVNHHIYNFGNTSIFLSIGKTERTPVIGKDGKLEYKRFIPLGVVNDERVTSGAYYSRAFGYWRDLLANPAEMETPPATIQWDFPPEKMPGYRRIQRQKRRQEKKHKAI